MKKKKKSSSSSSSSKRGNNKQQQQQNSAADGAMMMTGHYNAARFAQKPLPQPTYNFGDVPKAERDLRHSVVQFIDNDRDAVHACMAEMLLLCKEALRRKRELMGPAERSMLGPSSSKPLSLEYLADRIDVDDPIFGYVVRTGPVNPCPARDRRWKSGMMQGFVTCTTFTNYQKTFEWNSRHDAAFSHDDDAMSSQRLSNARAWDNDNTLAEELQATVRCGDVWDEGIVWPRIAEISLLGGLGCGKTLVSLVIEHLEGMKASGRFNYDYVVLQATDNSISFYESMGFVRVGAIAKEENLSAEEDEKEKQRQEQRRSSCGSSSTTSSSGSDDEVVAEPIPDSSPEKPNAIARPCNIVSSEVTTYTTKKAGESATDVAKRCHVDVWDIIFLNRKLYPEIIPGSRLLAGTVLYIPVVPKKAKPKPAEPTKKMPARAAAASSPYKSDPAKAKEDDTPQWYVAKENETPRMIARKFNLICLDLVTANKGRLEGLMSNSRLKGGTRIKISHLDVPEEEYRPYAHWSFPDDQFEDGEPSYMMARRLNRRRGNAARVRPFLESLAVPVTEYKPTELVASASPEEAEMAAAAGAAENAPPMKRSPRAKKLLAAALDGNEPKPPKRPRTGFLFYIADQREKRRDELSAMAVPDATKAMSVEWKNLSDEEKCPYEEMAQAEREKYFRAKARYERELEAFREMYPPPSYAAHNAAGGKGSGAAAAAAGVPSHTLFNKVVRLKSGAMTEGSDYKYWYVLTFIPDLKWCHLAPMIEVGKFGEEKGKSKGRPKWMLLDESLGKEVDISASFCIPIKSRSLKKTLDADKEEWDIIDDGTADYSTTSSAKAYLQCSTFARGEQYDSDDTRSIHVNTRKHHPVRKSTASKPSTERKRKYTTADLPRLLVQYPGASQVTYVRLAGARLYDPTFSYPVKRRVGRPKGSTSTPKKPPPSQSQSQKKRGRPKGSKNKVKASPGDDSKKRARSSFEDDDSSAAPSSIRRRGPDGCSVAVSASARKAWACAKSSKKSKKPSTSASSLGDSDGSAAWSPASTSARRSFARSCKGDDDAPCSPFGDAAAASSTANKRSPHRRVLARSCRSTNTDTASTPKRQQLETSTTERVSRTPLFQRRYKKKLPAVAVRLGGKKLGVVGRKETREPPASDDDKPYADASPPSSNLRSRPNSVSSLKERHTPKRKTYDDAMAGDTLPRKRRKVNSVDYAVFFR